MSSTSSQTAGPVPTEQNDSLTESAEYDRRWNQNRRYGGEFAGYTPHFIRFMHRHAAPILQSGDGDRSKRALEVGCGAGFFTKELVNLGFDATGIDLSAVGIERAKSAVPEATFLQHDLTQPLPFDDESFDLVWCSEVLEHLFSPRGVLEQIRRVLRPGGQLLVTVPYHGTVKNLAIALLAFERHYDPEYPHVRFFTRKSLRRVTERAGLQVDELGRCGSNLGWRDWLVPTNILMAARRPRA